MINILSIDCHVIECLSSEYTSDQVTRTAHEALHDVPQHSDQGFKQTR